MSIQKPLSALTEADLHNLVTEQVRESETLDYKLEMYHPTDSAKKEMLHDVSSMANSRGGYLLIGIEAENEIPIKIHGIEDAEKAIERLLSSCLSGIDQRINGLNARPIPLANGRSVVAVSIPASTRMPHMVVFQGEDRFWIRHARQKDRMSVAEIREACSRVENLMERAEAFLERRRKRVQEKLNLSGYNCLLRVALTPISVTEERLDISREDIRALMKNPPGMRNGGWVIKWPSDANVEPTMYGLKIATHFKSLEVFRNGHGEFQVEIKPNGHFRFEKDEDSTWEGPLLFPLGVVEYTVSVFRFYQSLCELVGINDPLIVTWEILRANGWGLRRFPEVDYAYYAPRKWEEAHLIIPERQIPNLAEPDRMAKAILDRVWQAFGHEKAPYFGKEGDFEPPKN